MSSSDIEEKTETKAVNDRLLQLPMTRIKTIMKSSPELGNVSQEAYFMITRATEHFIQYLAVETHKSSPDQKMIEYKSLAKIVQTDESLEFLEEIVPPKMKVSEYWKKIGYTPETERSPAKKTLKSPTEKSPTGKSPVTSAKEKIKSLEPIVID